MLKMIAAWAGIFLVMITAYAFRDEAEMVFNRVRGAIVPSAAITTADGVVELRKGRGGHFRAAGDVNGADVEMLVDTGASLVVLTYEDAAAAGLDPENLIFSRAVLTANGRAFVAPVTLEAVSVGSITRYRVEGAVAAQGALGSSLLGMSFLGDLAETSFRGDALILRD